MTDNQELELDQLRFTLAMDRIREIPGEGVVPEPFRDFFEKEAAFFLQLVQVKQQIEQGWMDSAEQKELEMVNRSLYEDILPDKYEKSYGNPAWAVQTLGEAYGNIFCVLYAELAGSVVYVYEKRDWDLLISLELFLEFYSAFQDEFLPEPEHLREILISYINDYCPQIMEYRVRELVDPSLDFAAQIIEHADLGDLRYLYRFGEYVTENELRTAAFLNSLPEAEVEAMARTYTEGYRIGFEVTGKNLAKKKTVNIRFCLGFERMVKHAIRQFREMGLEPVIYRCASHSLNKRGNLRIGFYGAIPNPQYDYDHKNDAALYLDEKLVTRKLRAQQEAFEAYKSQANTHAGPACIDVFGEIPFVPETKKEALQLSKEQQKLEVRYNQEAGQITNRYIIGEERSFTIIAYPIPEIGDDFEAIFRETVKINTLDYKKYQKLQQTLIDALDQGEKVRVLGMNGNETDLTIMLHQLSDPAEQTNFENCVADVNIPVGEVFTSPVLTGTQGLLHVKGVYLDSFHYDDLKIQVKDGMTMDYSCANFATEEENRRYIEENILFHHDSLPMGEFAIGTNTTAYRMAKDFGIADKLPILIAEKMGPHFAFGDTCYSWAEDTPVYNPDGKEIIARDNERSLLRKEDVSKAYFGCHTDITIPYDELGSITVICSDGKEIPLIREGRFVLEGTEELNEPLDHIG
ncbi:MAG: aminopeptidase [Lachnospiraceae bacterium]|nr:aminopeptidase [Lachnospiraceae bacterium]